MAVTPCAAGVDADVEPGPVVDCCHDRWRCLHWKISRERRRGEERCKRDAAQNMFHDSAPCDNAYGAVPVAGHNRNVELSLSPRGNTGGKSKRYPLRTAGIELPSRSMDGVEAFAQVGSEADMTPSTSWCQLLTQSGHPRTLR